MGVKVDRDQVGIEDLHASHGPGQQHPRGIERQKKEERSPRSYRLPDDGLTQTRSQPRPGGAIRGHAPRLPSAPPSPGPPREVQRDERNQYRVMLGQRQQRQRVPHREERREYDPGEWLSLHGNVHRRTGRRILER